MTTRQLKCSREGCPETFDVNEAAESSRCPACGQKHTPPWEEYETSGKQSTTVEVPPGTSIRVTIDIVPPDQ